MRKVAVISSASGNGKTTFGRALAERLGVPFHELDALHHGPSWTEATPAELRAKVEPIVETEAWVIDGAYRGKLGDLVLERADAVVWLDLPLWVWLPRLLRRTVVRLIRREELWNGNRESLRDALSPRNSVVFFALRHYRRRRRTYPSELARFPVFRLRTQAEVERFLVAAARST
ncbi:MAG: adenylate kinase [Gaiellaceae bacterium]